MKKIILLAAILLTACHSFAQFKISGTIINLKKADTLTLNIPFVYGYYKENNTPVPVNARGQFSINIPLQAQKFATLEYHNKTTTLLLSPGKNLVLKLDTGGIIQTFTGTAAEESRLLYQAKLNEIPYFMAGERKTNAYAELNPTQLQEKLVKPWYAQRDGAIRRVLQSNIAAADKNLISAEITYHAYTGLNDFARVYMRADRNTINSFILDIYKGARPEPAVFPAGPFYYWYADSYLNYIESKTFEQYDPKEEGGKKAFLETYKISIDSATRLVKFNGKAYIGWYLLNLYFPNKVGEQFLAQAIWTACQQKDINHITPLLRDFKANFPQSNYLPLLQAKVDALNHLFKENQDNREISIFAGYQKVNSIYDVVNSLKGKVVYLDIWGTWCPPCRDELLYNPQLKKHFKGKDVVFVYLDMDEDDKDAEWQKFIRANGLTGIHLRKSNPDIQQIWKELLPEKDKRGMYPTYFIFDKNGKLVQPSALRPSNEGQLYTQLEKYL